jgi:hypothetical protein
MESLRELKLTVSPLSLSLYIYIYIYIYILESGIFNYQMRFYHRQIH